MSFLIIILMALGLVIGNTQSQYPPGAVLCGDLSEADCEILQNAQMAMSQITSLSMNGSTEMSLLLDQSFPIEYEINMNGAMGGDFSTLTTLQQMNLADSLEMLYNPEQLAEFINIYDAFLKSILIDMTMGISISPEMVSPGEPTSIELMVRAKDGIYYVYAEDPNTPGSAQWIGLDFSHFGEMYTQLLTESMSDVEMMDPAELQELMEFYNSELFQLFYNNPEFWNQFVNITRAEDQTVNGQSVAVFITTWDWAGLFNDERFQAVFLDYINMMMTLSEEDLGDMQTEDIVDLYSGLMTWLMSYMEMSQEQWIGLDDYYIYRVSATYSLEVDVAELAVALEEFLGEPLNPEDMGFLKLFISMATSVELGAFNETITVEAPEGVELIDPFAEMITEASTQS